MSGVAGIGRTHADDPTLRSRLQRETVRRGRLLLAGLEGDAAPVSKELAAALSAARSTLDG